MNEAKINYLKNNNVDIENAINYTGDYDTYNELIIDFLNNLSTQISELNEKKNISDMNNYAIMVHALKSNARCLGFNKLADISYDHEMQSKSNNIEYINDNFNVLLSEVEEVKNIINSYINM